VIAAAGPLAIAVLRLILPYDTTDDAAATAAKVAAAPVAEGVVLWLTYLALLTLPLGVLIASRQAMRARPAFGAVAAAVAWVGFTSLFASVAIGDYLAQAAPTTRTANSTTAALLDAINALPATATASIVFVAGHILGGILLGIALWRVIPAWTAVALAISQPLTGLTRTALRSCVRYAEGRTTARGCSSSKGSFPRNRPTRAPASWTSSC
jgi:hypothetical protein